VHEAAEVTDAQEHDTIVLERSGGPGRRWVRSAIVSDDGGLGRTSTTAGGEAACHAPFTSLYLDQRGYARACPLNNATPLGNIGRSTLREIWNGPAARALRQRFREGEWGTGCDVCAWQSRSAGDEQVYARLYDELPLPDDEPEWPIHLELALSNRCNLQCVMCSGDQSSSIRRHREGFAPMPAAYPERFFDELVEVLPHLQRAKFLGGEPFLVREHHRVWDLMVDLDVQVPIHVTTNGTIWNDRVERVLEHLPTSLAISVDGVRPETIAKVRVGVDPDVLMANLERFQAYVRERGTYLSLTYCLMTENWQEFGDFLVATTARDLDAYVNTVTGPARLSLYRLPPEQLAEVVAALEADDDRIRPHLGRNEAVWDDQLTRLRGRLAQADQASTPRWLLRASNPAKEVGVTVQRSGHAELERLRADDEAILRQWAEGGPVTGLDLDRDDRIISTTTDGDGFLHLPSDVRSITFDEVAVLLSSFYGRRTTVEVLHAEAALEDRVACYETPGEETALRSRIRPIPLPGGKAGVRLVVAARRRARTPSVVVAADPR
jgi:MoaA/NifB/PqqE/SkfB family radical SAM enzyme